MGISNEFNPVPIFGRNLRMGDINVGKYNF